MKSSPEYSNSKDYLYTMFMVDELKKVPYEKKPATTIQAASTQAILSRPKEKDEEWFNRPIPLNWKAKPDAKTQDEAVGMRQVTPQEIQVEETRRRGSKNTLGDAVSGGARGVAQDSVERAISAYTCSPATELSEADKMKLKALMPYEPVSEKKMIPTKPPRTRFLNMPIWAENTGAGSSLAIAIYLIWKVLH